MKILILQLTALLLLTTLTLTGCTKGREAGEGQSQVRGGDATTPATRQYGNPPAMDDWEQRGESGLPTGKESEEKRQQSTSD